MKAERDSRNGVPGRDLTKELGLRIAGIRKRRGWSQSQLAARLGVPRDRLSKWERGMNAPSLDDLSGLSEVLEVPLEELGPAAESLHPERCQALCQCPRF